MNKKYRTAIRNLQAFLSLDLQVSSGFRPAILAGLGLLTRYPDHGFLMLSQKFERLQGQPNSVCLDLSFVVESEGSYCLIYPA